MKLKKILFMLLILSTPIFSSEQKKGEVKKWWEHLLIALGRAGCTTGYSRPTKEDLKALFAPQTTTPPIEKEIPAK